MLDLMVIYDSVDKFLLSYRWLEYYHVSMILPDRLSAWCLCCFFRLMAINLTIRCGFCCFFRLMAIDLAISWGFFWLAIYLTITTRCNDANECLALFNHLSSSKWIQPNAVVSQRLLERNLSPFMGTGGNVRSDIHITI